MNPENPIPENSDAMPSFVGAGVGTEVGTPEAAPEAEAAAPAKAEAPRKDAVQAYDFRNPMLLSPVELRKMRLHEEEFVESVASRLSVQFRTEFILKLTSLRTVTYQKLAESWTAPSHFNLFKIEPLRGVCILDIATSIGFCMVDRLMGGPGQPAPAEQEISEIEKVLLEQAVQVFLEEWCSHWVSIKDLKSTVLGYENNGSFIQATSREAVMLVVGLEATMGECTGVITLSVPFVGLEPMIKRFCQSSETVLAPAVPAPATPTAAAPIAPGIKWNACFNDVPVPVTAEIEGIEMSAREILALKIGDVVPLQPRHLQTLNVRIADILKFKGRPGTQSGCWAVELTKVLKS